MTIADELRAGRRDGLEAADLRGADLSRIRLSCVSLVGAQLDEADLSEAELTCVDLSRASMRGANLHRTHLDQVKAPRANLAGLRATHAFFEGVDLAYADLKGSHLDQALLRGCNLDHADLDDSSLVDGKIAYCNCTAATFRRTDLDRVLTVGSRFLAADLDRARHFYLCRDIVAEILLREVEDDFERARLVGVVAISPTWCFKDWKAWLAFHPGLQADALRVFEKYPDSGCAEALREGYAGGR